MILDSSFDFVSHATQLATNLWKYFKTNIKKRLISYIIYKLSYYDRK